MKNNLHQETILRKSHHLFLGVAEGRAQDGCNSSLGRESSAVRGISLANLIIRSFLLYKRLPLLRYIDKRFLFRQS